ncbi:hypothetical protein [Cellulosimicrobium sp. TH-20]|uniref:phage terminase small subunit n=1 Tax=Cellulosimicrobium sp. TH-20 TaxID=1980001 RepID=UPI00119F003E|nr:hypothetical protein [Cellulosimicrobium sp. TH-20]
MAGRGPLPQETRQRERDTKRRAGEFTTVTRDDVARGPDLVEATGRADWSADTARWWDDWRRAPQAALFERTDWRRLALLAVMVEGYFRRPSAAAMSEIRMNEERLGATYADRLRSRIRIEAAEDATVTPLTSIKGGRSSARARFAATSAPAPAPVEDEEPPF